MKSRILVISANMSTLTEPYPSPADIQQTSDRVKSLFTYITKEEHGNYLGESISQLEHALQAAMFAAQSSSDEETVLGALLHDIGRYVPTSKNAPEMITPDGETHGRQSHDKIGELYLRGFGFSEKVCQLVGGHVSAKRYLTGKWPEYYDELSHSSKTTLKFQGGPMLPEELKLAEQDPWLQDKLNVRKWDDLAKNPEIKAPAIDTYVDIAVKNIIDNKSKKHAVTVHGRQYPLPKKVTVVICVDGFDPDYLQYGFSQKIIPNIEKIYNTGFHTTAKSAMPSFTNPNNVSIISGVPPSIHGIAGNFYLDQKTGETHMVLDSTLLRGETIFSEMAKRSVRVGAVTAKDKLRKILQYGIDNNNHVCISSEKADECLIPTIDNLGKVSVAEWLGRENPSMYSGELSLFALDAGVKLVEEHRVDLLYVSLSDYIQHKHAPNSKEAVEFFKQLDAKVGEFLALDCVVGITGDHGMSDKSNEDGTPNVVFIQDILDGKYGRGTSRVICPITDPFVGHHGALGGFVRIHLQDQLKDKTREIVELLQSIPQVEEALAGEKAAIKLETPLDREGDISVISVKGAVLGARKEDHDLTQLHGHRLRSHGAYAEQDIPLLVSEKCAEVGPKPRNFDVFFYALNCQ